MKKIFVIFLFCMNVILYGGTYNLVTLQYPPYQYEENGEKKGFVMQIIDEVFHRLGEDYNLEIIAWKRALKMVEDGDADIIFTIYKNDEREKFLDYSNEILIPQKTAFFVLKDNLIKYNGDFENLSDYIVGTVFGVSYGFKFDEAIKKNELKTESVMTGDINIKKLLDKRIDLIVSNEYGAMYLMKKYSKLDKIKKLEPILEEIPSYIAFSKKKNLGELRDRFDKELKKMKDEGRYQEIILEFFLSEK